MKIKTIEQKCIECSKLFLALKKEVVRGNAKYCSISCGATASNKQRHLHNKHKCFCKYCGHSYDASQQSKFCSVQCKAKHNSFKRSRSKESGLNELAKLPCELCGWHEATRDLHHIIPISKNGVNDVSNVVCLCPNCHRKTHKNLISQEQLLAAVNRRTISSSVELTTELGADVVIKETKLLH